MRRASVKYFTEYHFPGFLSIFRTQTVLKNCNVKNLH